jgi:hypothetical protein
MKKLLCILVLPLLLSACNFNYEQPNSTDPQKLSISQNRDSGPQDVICHSGGVITYEHKDVVLYSGILHNSTVLDVYEKDTQEKIGLPVAQCNWRPHKK